MHRRFYGSLLLTLLLIGCGGQQTLRQPAQEPVAEGEMTRVDSLTPTTIRNQQSAPVYAVAGDDWVESWDPEPVQVARYYSEKIPVEASEVIPGESGLLRVRVVRGFRVQLYNDSNAESAERIVKIANTVFDTVYVKFLSPNYRVRGGDFRQRSVADQAASRARDIGLRGAWVVPDRVNVFEHR